MIPQLFLNLSYIHPSKPYIAEPYSNGKDLHAITVEGEDNASYFI